MSYAFFFINLNNQFKLFVIWTGGGDPKVQHFPLAHIGGSHSI